MTKIGYAQLTCSEDYDNTLIGVGKCNEFVDSVIIIDDGSLSKTQLTKLQELPNVTLLTEKFEDSLPKQRNIYIRKAKELGMDWLIVSDPDEIFSDYFWNNIGKIIERTNSDEINMYGVNCRNAFGLHEWTDNYEKLIERPTTVEETNLHKYMVFKLYPDLQYYGLGKTGMLHETWYSTSHPWLVVYLPKEFFYIHRKSGLKIWESAARNLFIAGGGMNVGELNEMWRDIKRITERLSIENWRQFRDYVTKGNISRKSSLIDWISKGLIWKACDYGVEVRATCMWMIYHNRWLLEHDQIRTGLNHIANKSERDRAEDSAIRIFINALGRWPLNQERNFCANLVLNHAMSEDQIAEMLRGSQEFMLRNLREQKLEQILGSSKTQLYQAFK